MLEKLKEKKIIGAIGIATVFLGVLLPYYQVSIFGHTYKLALWNYIEGKVILLLLTANFLFLFRDFAQKYVPQVFESNIGQKIQTANPKLAIVPVILIVAFVVILFLRLDVGSTLDHGMGFYFLWLGIICLTVHTFLYKNVEPVSTQYTNGEQINKDYSQTMQNRQQLSYLGSVKYCSGCGNKCEANTNICSFCGRQL